MKKIKAENQVFREYYPILGERLWQLAVEWSRKGEPTTQKLREAAIKACKGREVVNGSRSIRAAREMVEKAAAALRVERKYRLHRRATARLGYAPYSSNRVWKGGRRQPTHSTISLEMMSHLGAVLPTGSLDERLRERTEQLIRKVLPFRIGAAGGTSFDVRLTCDPNKVSYSVYLAANRDTYAGKFKGWLAREDHHYVVVPHGWITRVYKRGLACVDGMLTLDATPLDHAPRGIHLYAAVWVEQGRGYTVHTRHGIIAIADDGTSYHGANVNSALCGLQQKIQGRKLEKEWKELASVAYERFREAVKPHSDVLVRVADAKAIGACEYGIRNWCNQVGLNYEAGAATLAQVLEGYEKRSVPEARLAIIRALRRVRRAPAACMKEDEYGTCAAIG